MVLTHQSVQNPSHPRQNCTASEFYGFDSLVDVRLAVATQLGPQRAENGDEQSGAQLGVVAGSDVQRELAVALVGQVELESSLRLARQRDLGRAAAVVCCVVTEGHRTGAHHDLGAKAFQYIILCTVKLDKRP